MSTEAWSGVEGLEAEGFGFGGVDNFPDIDAHAIEEHFEFVDECDIDGTVGVFEDFAGFGDFGIVDADHFDDGVAVEIGGEISGVLIGSADDFGDTCCGVVGIPWVLTFGAEGSEVIVTAAESGGIIVEDGDEHIASGGGVGGAFEDHELSGAEDAGDGEPSGFDKLEVRVAGFVEWCGNADEECIGFVEPIHIAGWIKYLALDPVRDGGGGNVSNVADTAAKLLDFGIIDVVADAFEAGVSESADEGKSDITESDDADAGCAGTDFLSEFCGEGFGRMSCSSVVGGAHAIFPRDRQGIPGGYSTSRGLGVD